MKKSVGIIFIILSVLLAGATAVFAYLYFASAKQDKNKDNGTVTLSETELSELKASAKDEAREDMLSAIKTELSGGRSVIGLLKEAYPDKLIYVNSSGNYTFADIDNSLKKSNLDMSAFVTDDNGVISYNKGGVSSHMGIDVSSYQGDIDFSKVKSAGVEYVFVRSGYRTYGGGIIKADTAFETNVTEALKNNIKVGVYFFSMAVDTDEAIEEADFVIDKIKPYNITYPVVIDVEEIAGDSYRTEDLSQKEMTDIVIAFCERIKSAGYTPMIYFGLKYMEERLDMSRLEDYDKWFAYYSDNPYIPYSLSAWQYASDGKIDGIDTSVDMNISFKTW